MICSAVEHAELVDCSQLLTAVVSVCGPQEAEANLSAETTKIFLGLVYVVLSFILATQMLTMRLQRNHEGDSEVFQLVRIVEVYTTSRPTHDKHVRVPR